MRHNTLCVLILFSPWLIAKELTIGTFNCEFLNQAKVHVKYGVPLALGDEALAKKWDQGGFRREMFDQAISSVSRTILEMGLDVAILTEVGPEDEVQLLSQELRRMGSDYPFVATCMSQERPSQSGFFSGQHVAVLSKEPMEVVSRFLPGRESYDLEADDPDREMTTGIDKGLHVIVHFENRDIHVFGAHLQSERGGFENDERRIAQASIIRRLVLPLLKQGAFVIVAGDLNDSRGQPTLRRIRGRDDIEEDLVQTGFKEFFEPAHWDQRWTYEYEGVRAQIDHILLSPNLALISSPKTRIHPVDIYVRPNPDNGEFRVSDHRALIVTLFSQ